ncbi:MAG: GntR family transcriptional regulator [Lentisphaeria bacterium]|nr:GntR family transcriptional regulator [Lentisphaeria bacterium]
MSKTKTVEDLLREQIGNGSYPDGRLPGERELAVQFQVGRNTVRAALHRLESEGWIERHRKKGTLIRAAQPVSDRGLAGIIMRTSGHLYEDFHHCLLTGLIQAGYSVQSVSISPIVTNRNHHRAGVEAAIRKLLKADPKVLILDGFIHSGIPLIGEIRKRDPILFDFYDSALSRKFTGVWFDYRKAGYLAGKYLTGRGCRHPVLFTDQVPPKVRLNPNSYRHHKTKLLIEGFRQAMVEAGIDSETSIIDFIACSRREHQKVLDELSSRPENIPDGFCGGSDILTVDFIRHLLEDYGKIPKNILFAGIGNTPWSREPSLYPFTSVDLNVEKAVETIVRQAELPPERRQDIFIEPKLIERHPKNPIGI